MASSSSSPSASTFSSQVWKYHVFLSFRGEDTRKTFVDHLYTALIQQGIHTYKDDETLPRGESIGPTLRKAIENSQIAIIVFSKNYADSTWCLDELEYIMKCKDTRGQIVMPIFYDVDPSEVRKRNSNYGEAFVKHERENKDKVGSWKKMLVDASNISGWETKNIANGYESKVIQDIVYTISQKLQLVTSSADKNLIGIEARVQELESKLQTESGGVRMIGIWGVGGGGKTTLASSVYGEISSKFDGCCFVENIREESSRYGLGKLKAKILSELVVNRVGGGGCLINNRFRDNKVLLVLDDVDQRDQLEALAGSHDWFGEGSRIIITTRNEHLLISHRVNAIHNISLLNDDDAIKLFCKHAHGVSILEKDFKLLSKHMVSYAGGLPLALKVLGSFLCDKDINEWRSALVRLKNIPETDILDKLKVSFDGLKLVEKELFLDIACFFRGRYKDERVMMILDACGFHPVIGVKVLIQKALITISDDGMFDMHDLVQEMGHYIVRGKHPNNPEKHSRVWKMEDVRRISAMDETEELDMIEAIRFECNRYEPMQSPPPIAGKMKNLRWIDWRGDIASPFPANFPPRELCSLVLYGILQKQLWKGYKNLGNLKIMELCGLENLILTPDFDGLPNLERFKLMGSSSLEEVHPSIGRLEKLVSLSIENCDRLNMFPTITRLKKLETLTISWCPKLFKLPERNINHHIGLRFFHNLQELGLRMLDLSYCDLGDEDIGSEVWELSNLQKLNLAGNNFSRLNFCLFNVPLLKWLNMSYCEGLVELSELPSSIAVVIADWCTSLKTIGDISRCKWLWKISLRGENRLGPLGGDKLLRSMLQGNGIKDHFINVNLEHQISTRLVVDRRFRFKYTMCLPHDWYNDYCGFLIHIVSYLNDPNIEIIMKQELKCTIMNTDRMYIFDQEEPKSTIERTLLKKLYDEDSESESLKKTLGKVSIGYVSFSSLRQMALLNSSYNVISVSSKSGSVEAELVPRKSKAGEMQKTEVTTEWSDFWDEEVDRRKTFSIKHGSKSCIEILWRPYSWF